MLVTFLIILNRIPIYNDAFHPVASIVGIVNITSINHCYILLRRPVRGQVYIRYISRSF